MFAKRLLQAVQLPQHHLQHGNVESSDFDMRISVHHGIPSTSSVLAFDPIQRLLAIGTLDGRIKVIGGDGIEGLLISPSQLPYKNIEFLQNQGFLVSISNDNEFQVWNLESRLLVCCVKWESNVTAFSVISGTTFMYVGDEYGSLSVMKYDVDSGKLLQLPYHISEKSLHEIAGFSLPNYQPIVGVLPQPYSSGDRVLIVYENGLIILWDISEARILFVGGGKDLQLKDEVVNSPNKYAGNLQDDTSEHLLEDKEISSLCWASSDGSILAVGYIDGDILLWNTSYAASAKGKEAGLSCKNVVKLQLSSVDRRLPVIVLQWSIADKSRNNCDGLLFIYGGDEIGSEEVLTVLSLEWSSGMDAVKCVGRVDLTLTGSFADMILLQKAAATGAKLRADLFVLTSPGQLQYYDDVGLSSLISQQERKPSVSAYAMEFPSVIPTADPPITVAKLSVAAGSNSSKALAEIPSAMKQGSTETLASSTNWPLTGGVPSELFITEHNGIERLYVGGYKDGSVRIWNATYPILSLMFLLDGEVPGIKVAGSSAPVSKLDFCFVSLTLAVGNECGLVRVYNLKGGSDDTSFHFISETKHEVHNIPQEKQPYCKAVFHLTSSSIQVLRFAQSGAKLVLGFECGRVAALDMSSLSVLFFKDCISDCTSPIISIDWKEFSCIHSTTKSPKHSETKTLANHMEEVVFILTKDSKVNVIDGGNGNIISSQPFHLKKEVVAISMYVIEVGISASEPSSEKHPNRHMKDTVSENLAISDSSLTGSKLHEMGHQSIGAKYIGEELLDSLVLLCCENALRLYSTKSVLQGNGKTIRKVKLAKPCCWTTTFMKDDKVCGLMLLYQTGLIEIRSLPDLELMKESTLMSILRWNFKANMDKMISSSDSGQIAMVNGCELAFISLLAVENDFRIPESLPCLHDKVLAAAADAAFSVPLNQKKKQGVAPGILGGIVKGFKGRKDFSSTSTSDNTHLEAIFLKGPSLRSSHTSTNSQEIVAPSLTVTDKHEVLELDIDDIEIDEPLPVSSSASSHTVKNKKKEKGSEREQLFEGGTEDSKPRLRTREEIIAKYRKAGDDTSSVAANARNKLVERQEKLEKISKRTEDLQNGAEDFASLANELVKTMENRKWWHI